ncbi:MAG: DODA-type extradiol aromatic ring-opening family dioxygenase [Castellaniella sp.]|uniref:DODA-type extradiol aromatic ring-opening family dioxygenase n=1 Tax=Castellaniella sp. TaxID=1955812 RepID=UPI003A86440A
MRQPVFFLSHGGGPWPWMPEAQASYAILAAELQAIPATLPRPPEAILMVSAHWITQGGVLLGNHPQPGMLYDYYGFPAHTYGIRYPALGSPDLAARAADLLRADGIPVDFDAQRGFDHGAFVPAHVMFPAADIPMVQLSIEHGFDPDWHRQLGAALTPLRDEGVLIIGSGLSYHNLRLSGPAGRIPSAQFDAWLQQAMAPTDATSRHDRLRAWKHAPAARIAHPQEDHLVPLFVANGASEGSPALCCHHETDAAGGLTVSSFRFD